MPNYLEANLVALKAKFPQAEQVLSAAATGQRKVEIYSGASGLVNLKIITPDGKKTDYHRPQNPFAEIAEQLDQGWQRSADLLIVTGMGLGYHLGPILAEDARTRILIVEPEPLALLAAMHQADLAGVFANERIHLLLGADAGGIANSIDRATLGVLLPDIRTCRLESIARLRPHALETVASQWSWHKRKSGLRLRSHRAQRTVPPENIVVNVARGCGYNRTSELEGRAQGRAAIIVNSGPSLEKNGHLLPQFKGRAVIVTSGSALVFLERFGVEPDVVIAADPLPINRIHLVGRLSERVLLVHDAATDPEFVTAAGGKPVLANCGHELTKYLEGHVGKLGDLLSWGSVTSAALDLALRMGCNPIAFVGMDQAFIDDQHHYLDYRIAPNLPADIYIPPPDFIQTKDIFGGDVKTLPSLVSYRDWLQQRIAAISDRLIVNATEGGVMMGMRHMSLRALLAGVATHSVRPPLAQSLLKPGYRQPDFSKIIAAMKADLEWIETRLRSDGPVEYPWNVRGEPLFHSLIGAMVDELVEMEGIARGNGARESEWSEFVDRAVDRMRDFVSRAVKIVRREGKV